MKNCQRHPQVAARWRCGRCGNYWCPQCCPAVKGVCKSFAFCPECLDFCEKVEES